MTPVRRDLLVQLGRRESKVKKVIPVHKGLLVRAVRKENKVIPAPKV